MGSRVAGFNIDCWATSLYLDFSLHLPVFYSLSPPWHHSQSRLGTENGARQTFAEVDQVTNTIRREVLFKLTLKVLSRPNGLPSEWTLCSGGFTWFGIFKDLRNLHAHTPISNKKVFPITFLLTEICLSFFLPKWTIFSATAVVVSRYAFLLHARHVCLLRTPKIMLMQI